MSFIRFIAVLEVLAECPKGATAGYVQSRNVHLTHTQIKKTLKELVGEGMVRVEGLQYRPHIVSSVYHINAKAREYIGYVADKYDRTELQHQLFELNDHRLNQGAYTEGVK